MATVDKPIVDRATTKVVLRPMRSPKWPNSAEPTGRARNAIPNVASVASVAETRSDFGKNRAGKTGRARNAIPNVASETSVAEAGSDFGKNRPGKTSTAAVA